jgi:hypothetical protein
MINVITCPINTTYNPLTIWAFLVVVLIGLSFYLLNWEKKNKWYINLGTILLIIGLIIFFAFTGLFAQCI